MPVCQNCGNTFKGSGDLCADCQADLQWEEQDQAPAPRQQAPKQTTQEMNLAKYILQSPDRHSTREVAWARSMLDLPEVEEDEWDEELDES
ncbi:MAG TPA: hypothetical protein VHP83_22330 [Aggregatilineaceae bacterium]|nr:hypothetical protein [Aggregatilineaceae bacterium]